MAVFSRFFFVLSTDLVSIVNKYILSYLNRSGSDSSAKMYFLKSKLPFHILRKYIEMLTIKNCYISSQIKSFICTRDSTQNVCTYTRTQNNLSRLQQILISN